MPQKKNHETCRLDGKVAIVTGSAEGIGEATAKLFAREGAKTVIADINRTKGENVANEITTRGGEAIFIPLDVTSEKSWQSLMEETISRFGKLNVLVNNAGIIKISDIENTSLEDWHRIMEVNATGVFLGTKFAVLSMKDNGELCSIINRSSVAGQIGDKNMFAYCASKGAVTLLTKSVALSCADKGYRIRVNSVHPAYVSTSMTRSEAAQLGASEREYMEGAKELHPLGLGEPIDVACLDLFLASDESKWITGGEFNVDGGFTAQ
jgi:NAD(P)-dependent dehydrogenase (short-subunit alcohol dehydrogenase family)